MNYRIFSGCAVLAIASSLTGPAQADCAGLQLLDSIKIESVADGRRMLVPVTINGNAEKLVLDTGGVSTQLDAATAQKLGLRIEDSRLITFDAAGNASAQQVNIESFQLGRQSAGNIMLQIAPSNYDADNTVVGLLSTDLFRAYDIDLDFAARRLNYFSQDHCEGAAVYWPERPLSIVPFHLTDGHVTVAVKIDGHALRAVIDTGAEGTVMLTTAASEIFGLTPGSAEMPEAVTPGTSDPQMKYYSHKFSSLSFGDVRMANPNIVIMANRIGAGPGMTKSTILGVVNDPFNRVQTNQLIIGMDVLKQLHLYIAYGERRLYISPAGNGESTLEISSSQLGSSRLQQVEPIPIEIPLPLRARTQRR
jgi:predicted aspartyl protease